MSRLSGKLDSPGLSDEGGGTSIVAGALLEGGGLLYSYCKATLCNGQSNCSKLENGKHLQGETSKLKLGETIEVREKCGRSVLDSVCLQSITNDISPCCRRGIASYILLYFFSTSSLFLSSTYILHPKYQKQ